MAEELLEFFEEITASGSTTVHITPISVLTGLLVPYIKPGALARRFSLS